MRRFSFAVFLVPSLCKSEIYLESKNQIYWRFLRHHFPFRITTLAKRTDQFAEHPTPLFPKFMWLSVILTGSEKQEISEQFQNLMRHWLLAHLKSTEDANVSSPREIRPHGQRQKRTLQNGTHVYLSSRLGSKGNMDSNICEHCR